MFTGIIETVGKVTSIATNGSNNANPLTYLYSSGYKTDFRNLLNGSIRMDHELDFITKGLSTHAIVAYQNFNRQINVYNKVIGNNIIWRSVFFFYKKRLDEMNKEIYSNLKKMIESQP